MHSTCNLFSTYLLTLFSHISKVGPNSPNLIYWYFCWRLERQREVSIPCPVFSASLHQNKEVPVTLPEYLCHWLMLAIDKSVPVRVCCGSGMIFPAPDPTLKWVPALDPDHAWLFYYDQYIESWMYSGRTKYSARTEYSAPAFHLCYNAKKT